MPWKKRVPSCEACVMGLVHAGFKDIITPAGVLGSVPLVIGR